MSNGYSEKVYFTRAQLNELVRVFGSAITAEEVHSLMLRGDDKALLVRGAQQTVIDYVRSKVIQ